MIPLLPVVNARLKLIAGGGSSEDYYGNVGAETTKWAGDVDAYVYELTITDAVGGEGGEMSELTQTRISYADLGVTVVNGDFITYDRGAGNVTRRVRDENPYLPIGLIEVHLWNA